MAKLRLATLGCWLICFCLVGELAQSQETSDDDSGDEQQDDLSKSGQSFNSIVGNDDLAFNEDMKNNRKSEPHLRIINGYPVDVGNYPFMAELRLRRNPYGSVTSHYCGATIISHKHALTAAHCIMNRRPDDMLLVVGETNIQDNTDGQRIHELKTFHRHPQFKHSDNLGPIWDIAVVEVKEYIDFNTRIQPIRLADKSMSSIKPGHELKALGWGRTSNVGQKKPSASLRVVDLNYSDQSKCANDVKRRYNLRPDGPSGGQTPLICAGAPNRDTCNGDSGGPLFTERHGKAIQIGITSFGDEVCGSMPGVYASVSKSFKWIKGVTGGQTKGPRKTRDQTGDDSPDDERSQDSDDIEDDTNDDEPDDEHEDSSTNDTTETPSDSSDDYQAD